MPPPNVRLPPPRRRNRPAAGGSKPMLDRPGEQIATATLILRSLVGFTFHMFDDRELSSPQGVGDRAGCMKAKVQVDRRTEEVVDVEDLLPDVERDQCQPANCQYSPELEHDSAELGGLEVHDGIERDKPYKARGWQAERPHVAHPELGTRIEARGAPDHLWGDINSEDRYALIVKVFRDVSGAAAKVGHEPPAACFLGEPIQEMPVKRLLDQLRGQMLGVNFGGRIVTLTNIHNVRLIPNMACQDVGWQQVNEPSQAPGGTAAT